MVDKIKEHWSNREILGGVNCLVRKDGTVVLLSCNDTMRDGEQSNCCYPFLETTIESLERYNRELWTSVDVFTNICEIGKGNFVMGGEGGMGNQGFIVCTDENNNFNWSLYFLDSNPFYKIEVLENEIHAFSSYDLDYQVDIANPEKIRISHSELSL